MTRLLFLLLLLTLFSVAAMWFVENDGSIIVEWMGYRIQTSVAFASLAGIIVIVICAMVLQLLFWVKSYPMKYKKELNEKRREKGLTALTKGFAAIAAGDTKHAKRLTKKATQNLGAIPLTKLLSAQIAQLEGNREQARIHYTAMLESKETEMIAIKGLLIQARQEGDINKAIFLAEKALGIRADADWAISILIDLYKRNKQWENAEQMIALAVKKKYIPESESKRSLAIVMLAKALDASNSKHHSAALKIVQQSHKLLPDFVPTTIVYADILLATDNKRKAIKVLENGWKLNPHPEIAQHYMRLFIDETNNKKMQRAEKLYKLKPDHVESHIVVARTAIAVNNPSKARNHLKIALQMTETTTICHLMIEVERQENASPETINQWENRAAMALTDPVWNCKNCGYLDQHWHVNCSNCDSFDSMRWGTTMAEDVTYTPQDVELLAHQ